jgi:uncharacterized alkaline shock family protein YloU
VELAGVATNIQQHVAQQVEKMTSKGVARVNVVIDEVRPEEEKEASENWDEEQHTD